jgi:hypothetical protein
MAYIPHEGAEKMLDVICKAEGFTIKLYANNLADSAAYTIADFITLTTESSWGGWGASTSHRTISTSAWATSATASGELARSTSAQLTWTFTTTLTATTKTGSFTTGSTIITGLTGASVLYPGMKVEYPTAVTSACIINTTLDSSRVTISESPTLTTAAAPINFRPQIHGHILIGSSSSKIYRMVSHSGWQPEKNGDYYTISPTMSMPEPD